jgi:hypothetical protein
LAFNARLMACTNVVGLLLAFLEQASSFLPTNGGSGSGGGGTITRSTLTHLAGMG